jgi:hypothetical protein
VERPRGLRRAFLLPAARLRAQRRRRRPQVLLTGLRAARGAVPARGGRRSLLLGVAVGCRPLSARRRPAVLRAPGGAPRRVRGRARPGTQGPRISSWRSGALSWRNAGGCRALGTGEQPKPAAPRRPGLHAWGSQRLCGSSDRRRHGVPGGTQVLPLLPAPAHAGRWPWPGHWLCSPRHKHAALPQQPGQQHDRQMPPVERLPARPGALYCIQLARVPAGPAQPPAGQELQVVAGPARPQGPAEGKPIFGATTGRTRAPRSAASLPDPARPPGQKGAAAAATAQRGLHPIPGGVRLHHPRRLRELRSAPRCVLHQRGRLPRV